MELVSKKTLMLFAGQGNDELTSEIAKCLDVPLGDVKLSTFASGELYARYGESIRGSDIFVVQSHCDPINDRIMQHAVGGDHAFVAGEQTSGAKIEWDAIQIRYASTRFLDD